MSIRIKRIYEPVSEDDGCRLLVDRLWPRGIRKEEARIDAWMKDIAPSAPLRKWFGHDPEKWTAFRARYKAELKGSPVLDELRQQVRDCRTVTLLYAAKEEQYNHARVLQQLLSKS